MFKQWKVLKSGNVRKESTKVLSCRNVIVEVLLLLWNAVEEHVSEGTVAGQGSIHSARSVNSEHILQSRDFLTLLKVEKSQDWKSKGFNIKKKKIYYEILKH